MDETGGRAAVGTSPRLTSPVSSADHHPRRWLGRQRGRHATRSVAAAGATDALTIRLRHDGRQHTTVEVAGLLVRRHVHLIGDALADAFAAHRAWFVVDLRGVSQLDPTALSTVMRHADEARRRGALVTVVPPGTSDRSAA